MTEKITLFKNSIYFLQFLLFLWIVSKQEIYSIEQLSLRLKKSILIFDILRKALASFGLRPGS